jgi:hypothetical protein
LIQELESSAKPSTANETEVSGFRKAYCSIASLCSMTWRHF